MKTKVYYDGACHFCSHEINHYRNGADGRLLELIDIADPKFSAEREGLDPKRVNQEMHVRSPDGKLHYGVDAFIELWRVMPKYNHWSTLAQNPVLKPFLKLAYRSFANIRPLLPKKKNNYGEAGVCELK